MPFWLPPSAPWSLGPGVRRENERWESGGPGAAVVPHPLAGPQRSGPSTGTMLGFIPHSFPPRKRGPRSRGGAAATKRTSAQRIFRRQDAWDFLKEQHAPCCGNRGGPMSFWLPPSAPWSLGPRVRRQSVPTRRAADVAAVVPHPLAGPQRSGPSTGTMLGFIPHSFPPRKRERRSVVCGAPTKRTSAQRIVRRQDAWDFLKEQHAPCCGNRGGPMSFWLPPSAPWSLGPGVRRENEGWESGGPGAAVVPHPLAGPQRSGPSTGTMLGFIPHSFPPRKRGPRSRGGAAATARTSAQRAFHRHDARVHPPFVSPAKAGAQEPRWCRCHETDLSAADIPPAGCLGFLERTARSVLRKPWWSDVLLAATQCSVVPGSRRSPGKRGMGKRGPRGRRGATPTGRTSAQRAFHRHNARVHPPFVSPAKAGA